uniref:Uncharacterized protein n=1 Tax=Astyanax mexicanus TaxID=7994 RepID=A0A3B1IKN7_ASTMX
MLLQRKIKGVSAQKLVQWLTDINICDITTVNERILTTTSQKKYTASPIFVNQSQRLKVLCLAMCQAKPDCTLISNLSVVFVVCTQVFTLPFHGSRCQESVRTRKQLPAAGEPFSLCTQTCSLTLTSFTEDQPSQEIRNLRLQKNPKRFIYMKDINYAELLSSFTMYIALSCTVCIGFFRFVVKNQVIKWDHITLFTSCICCHETTSYILCTCKSQLLPRDHLDVSPWWNDTFYEENTCALTETMDLVEQTILNTNLAKKTAEILPSSSTHSAQYTYTGWDWVFRGCVFASMVTFTVTLIQCCYVRCALRSLCKATHFVPSPCSCQLHKDCRSRPGMGYGLNWN